MNTESLLQHATFKVNLFHLFVMKVKNRFLLNSCNVENLGDSDNS